MKLFQTEQALELIAKDLTDVTSNYRLVKTFLPTRATSGSAGYDIRACIQEPITIHAGETVRIPTGFHLQTEDPSLVGSLHVRSSTGIKKGLILANSTGIVDADYPDQWYVFLHNLREEVVQVFPGERIAQVIFTKVEHLQELQEHSLDMERVGGIGSTNKKRSFKMTEINKVLKERGNRYGTFEGNATLSQDFKSLFKNHRRLIGKQDLPSVQKEAVDMILHKLSRIANGDATYVDNWVDIAGYAQLVVSTLTGESFKEKADTLSKSDKAALLSLVDTYLKTFRLSNEEATALFIPIEQKLKDAINLT